MKTSVPSLLAALVLLASCDRAPAPTQDPAPPPPATPAGRVAGDVVIDDRDVYPESVTSLRDGTLITGSIKGVLYRAEPQSSTAAPWVRPDETNRLQSVFGGTPQPFLLAGAHLLPQQA